jgi:hypothetical protein
MAKLVRKLADDFGLPATFTLDARRHGGMTELEEAELTTGRGRGFRGTGPTALMGELMGDMPSSPGTGPWRPPASVAPAG